MDYVCDYNYSSDMKQELINAIKARALEFGDFTLKSGKKSNFYLDVRKLALSGLLYTIVEELHVALGSPDYTEFNAIGSDDGSPSAIVGGYLALKAPNNMHGFMVRKNEKVHGKGGKIIGSLEKGDKCVMVEDVATTGGSLLTACAEVELFGATVVQTVVVVDRLQGAAETMARAGIPFKALVTLTNLDLERIAPKSS